MFIFDPIPNQAAQRHANTLKARENLSELNFSLAFMFAGKNSPFLQKSIKPVNGQFLMPTPEPGKYKVMFYGTESLADENNLSRPLMIFTRLEYLALYHSKCSG